MAEPSTAWPLEREDVLGDRNGALAWLEHGLTRGTLAALSRLPTGAQDVLAGAFAKVAMRVQRERCEGARRFVRQALPDASDARVEQLVERSWRHLATLLLRGAAYTRRLGTTGALDRHQVEWSDAARAVAASGSGAILVTPHVGDWEAGGALLPWLGFSPLYVVSRPPRNRPMSRTMQRERELHHVRLIHRHGAIEGIRKVIGGGGSVMMMLDQRAQQPLVIAPFFGKNCKCERSPAILIRRLRVPVVMFACYLTERPYRWRFVFGRTFLPDEFARKDPLEVTTLINLEMEKLILAAPEQYFWLHDRFRKKQPASDAAEGAGDEAAEPST